jgi:serine/threonine protein kinase
MSLSYYPESLYNDTMQDNILINHDGSAILSDFGLSRRISSALFSSTSQDMGNTAWLAPELLIGNQIAKHTKMSDVWACGMTLMVLRSFLFIEPLSTTNRLSYLRNYSGMSCHINPSPLLKFSTPLSVIINSPNVLGRTLPLCGMCAESAGIRFPTSVHQSLQLFCLCGACVHRISTPAVGISTKNVLRYHL